MGQGNSLKSYGDYTDIFSLNLRVRRFNMRDINVQNAYCSRDI